MPAKYDNTKGAPRMTTEQGKQLTWDEFATASARRGMGRRVSQYAPFVKALKVREPVDATFVFPRVNVRTLRSAIAKQGREAGLKVKTVLLDGRLVVARVE